MNYQKTMNFVFTLFLMVLVASCSSRKTPAPVIETHGAVPLSKKIKNSLKATQYIVKKGETLYSIAWRSGIDVREIAKLNNIGSPYHIYPGQNLDLVNQLASSVKKPLQNGKGNIDSVKVVKKPIAKKKKSSVWWICRQEK
ncbi:LysM peptidoglycan-binding domain-containing protein [Pseudocolwellia sp. HL-MZ19]|uniref:LysM peptidoglycan-binding domain-containing protein n=1 Tax=Pseudocolwellia sp. HL-MZ19 TaxID=3400846 RepID=UPI003CE89666